MSDRRGGSLLPTPVWLVLGAALGAAIGSCGGVGLASWLGRRS
jgi:hypothetical protein